MGVHSKAILGYGFPCEIRPKTLSVKRFDEFTGEPRIVEVRDDYEVEALIDGEIIGHCHGDYVYDENIFGPGVCVYSSGMDGGDWIGVKIAEVGEYDDSISKVASLSLYSKTDTVHCWAEKARLSMAPSFLLVLYQG